jgi:hypothetical protein
MNDGFFGDGTGVVEKHFHLFHETNLGRGTNRARQTVKIGRKRYDLYFST